MWNSRKILQDEGFTMPNQLRSFYRLHVYFTVPRILFQMGGIQSIQAQPADPTFNALKNPSVVASFHLLC